MWRARGGSEFREVTHRDCDIVSFACFERVPPLLELFREFNFLRHIFRMHSTAYSSKDCRRKPGTGSVCF